MATGRRARARASRSRAPVEAGDRTSRRRRAARAGSGRRPRRPRLATGRQPRPPPQLVAPPRRRAQPLRLAARPRATARARRPASSWRSVPGTGPGGRIEHADLDAFARRPGRRAPASPAGATPRATRQSRGDRACAAQIAEKMQEAKRRIPHFIYVEEVDVTELERCASQLNATKRSDQPAHPAAVPDRAMVRSLPEFPQINARFDDEAGVVHAIEAVHMRHRDADRRRPDGAGGAPRRGARPLGRAAEIARLAEAARTGKATREELSGSTITITSLGPLGGIVTTPVINQPEVAIVGPNRIVERPVVRDGAVVAAR